MTFRLDPTWWRHSHDAGETVVAGTPTRVFRFTTSAGSFLDDLEGHRNPDRSTRPLLDRLVGAGAIHPLADETWGRQPTLSDVTVVIPARIDRTDSMAQLHDLVDSLPRAMTILVIDDGSPLPIGEMPRAHVVRNDTALGPGAARNRAVQLVATDFVLFLDSDIVLPNGATADAFWGPLLFHLADPSVALVAPRVRSLPGTTYLARFELGASPLDMGPVPDLVRPGSRVAYVPSAALLARTSDFRSVHGFDTDLRYGEDVDLVWRADEAGRVCRYEPDVVVFHTPRSSWRAFAIQRFHYGTAAAPLESRHPGSTRPLRINRWSAAVLALALIGHPVVALGVAASTIVRLARTLRSVPDRWRVALHLAGRGHVFAGRMFLDAAVRTWWPITCLGVATSRRVRGIIGVTIVGRTLYRARRRMTDTPVHVPGTGQDVRPLDPIRTMCADVVDDVAYGSGVCYGAWRARDARCLMPRFD